MEVNLASDKLLVLKDVILDLIVNFEKETGLHVTDIKVELEKVCFNFNRPNKTQDIRISVSIEV